MCPRLAILKVWNTSATKSSEQKWRGEQSVTLKSSSVTADCWVPGKPHWPEPPAQGWAFGRLCWSSWDRRREFDIFSLCLLPQWSGCHSCVGDKGCHTLLLWGTLSLTHHCWCLSPSQTSSCPWSSSGRCWIQPQGTLLSQKSPPPPTKVEWNTKYLMPLRKERDVFILFCLFLYELEVFSNPVCWLQ